MKDSTDYIKAHLDSIPDDEQLDKFIKELIQEESDVVKFLNSVETDDIYIVLKSQRDDSKKVEIKYNRIHDDIIDCLKNFTGEQAPELSRGRQKGKTTTKETYEYCARYLYLEYINSGKPKKGVNKYIQEQFEKYGHPKSIDTIKSYLRNWD